MRPRLHRFLAALLLLPLLAGCGVSARYQARLTAELAAGRYEAACALAEKGEGAYGRNARLLYLLDTATLDLLCGRPEAAVQLLQRADDLATELWTLSLSREAGTYLVNDYLQPYPGEDYERAFINIVAAVAYLAAGEPEEALVECRRLDEKLTLLDEKYGGKNVYKEDAFGRYLSGLIYEALGEPNDAYIAYRKAYEAYLAYRERYGTPFPPPLRRDLVRLAARLGFDQDLAEYRRRFGPVRPRQGAAPTGRVVLIHFDGLAPRKVEDRAVVPGPSGPIPLAFPRLVSTPFGAGPARLHLIRGGRDATAAAEPFLAEDVERIARRNLSDRRARVVAKMLARAALKQAAIHQATRRIKDEGERRTARFLLNVANTFIERADTRSWRYLPARIHLVVADVAPGRYTARVTVPDRPPVPLGEVAVPAGGVRFLFYETMFARRTSKP
ncbi:hypothetical protein G3N55_11375 [Dissulfurirhabdus thermomarina]|uniref:Tetratricopeptide repeat protein n=1 Tax=Dissulfurirhabdus thermomarina TaxID=1765737 RepID=A0A6N9TQI4_DISTH|nr:hypothetical protein [Dissulfurirhabdus thermomarina]NDY43439.1 hypothetical protein [Dissulfurirhabdus thermomarina]NMX23835.1 hypothetical protein [Dissulfurirhabdus thermomarina]